MKTKNLRGYYYGAEKHFGKFGKEEKHSISPIELGRCSEGLVKRISKEMGKEFVEVIIYDTQLSNEEEKNLGLTPFLGFKSDEYTYMMLDRLKADLEYYFGWGNENEKSLWATTKENHIKEMRRLYNLVEIKPLWISKRDIEEYAKRLRAA